MKTKPHADDSGKHEEQTRPGAAKAGDNDSQSDSQAARENGIIGLEVEDVAGNKDAVVAAGEAGVRPCP